MKRRDFFKLMGIASGAALTACKVDNADRKLLPYLVPPEEGIIPGVPRYIRSTCMECPGLCGINIKIRDDKPVKLEGNSDHPVNQGALCMRGQASLARLYHPKRIKQPLLKDKNGKFNPITWEEAVQTLQTALDTAEQKNMRRIFLSSRTTGSLNQLINDFCKDKKIERLKEAEIYHHGIIKQTYQQFFGLNDLPSYHIRKSDFLITIGADLLDTFLSPVEWSKQYAEAQKNKSFKWFHFEPYLTLTGASASDRLTIKPGSEPYIVAYLLHSIQPIQPLPPKLFSQVPKYTSNQITQYTGLSEKSLQSLIKSLKKAENPLIISGGPALTKSNGRITAQYTAMLQWALGMVGNTLDLNRTFNYQSVGTIADLMALANACKENKVGTTIFSRFHSFAAMPAFVKVLKKAEFKAALLEMPGPLMEICDLVLPLSNPLESWGDAEPHHGVQSLLQPALTPLKDSRSEGDALLTLLGKDTTYRDYLAKQWQGRNEQWIQQGFRTTKEEPLDVQLIADIKLEKPGAPYKGNCLFIVPSLRTFDGRSSGIELLKEIPDPISTISYGRWISVSLEDTEKLNLFEGSVIEIESQTGKFSGPVKPVPGLPGGVTTIAIDALIDIDLQVDRSSGEFVFCLDDVKLRNTGRIKRLPVLAGASTTGTRSILPYLEHKEEHHHKYKRYTLYPPHEHKDYRWGLVIDLDACIGCSACVAACYIENNIPLVGKEEHFRGREMSWLRIEAYFNNPNQPEFIPMMCQQCDNAPCETVCPVFATYHNQEGLNAQVYNRCVGTRYCSNNCPYKVRRFNWFDHADSLPLYQISNPDLSVRPKGVMEKCTFCIQRIRFAKDQAKDEKRLVKDGDIIPACAQTCPTNAITFGNLMDPDSRVSQLAKSAGAYRVQELLGTEPAVYYIKKNEAKRVTAAGGKK